MTGSVVYLCSRPDSAGQPAKLIIADGPQRDAVHHRVRQRHAVRGRPGRKVRRLTVVWRVHLRRMLPMLTQQMRRAT